jgi:hypothetical protein
MRKLKPVLLATALALVATPVLACDAAKRQAMKEAHASAFAEADTNGDGALDAQEFQAFHQAMERQRAQ